MHVLQNVLGHPTRLLWHKESVLGDVDAVLVPGGFSYGDYLRTGSIARFSPVMQAVKEFADQGGLVLGICNGFQILCEAGLLPGALIRNRSLQFRCEHVSEGGHAGLALHSGYSGRQIAAHSHCARGGNYFCDAATLEELEAKDQILFQYADRDGDVTDHANPNGSLRNIAGICNTARNVAGMMPHPERAAEEP